MTKIERNLKVINSVVENHTSAPKYKDASYCKSPHSYLGALVHYFLTSMEMNKSSQWLADKGIDV